MCLCVYLEREKGRESVWYFVFEHVAFSVVICREWVSALLPCCWVVVLDRCPSFIMLLGVCYLHI